MIEYLLLIRRWVPISLKTHWLSWNNDRLAGHLGLTTHCLTSSARHTDNINLLITNLLLLLLLLKQFLMHHHYHQQSSLAETGVVFARPSYTNTTYSSEGWTYVGMLQNIYLTMSDRCAALTCPQYL